MDHRDDLLGDRHVDAVGAGQVEDRPAGLDALGGLPGAPLASSTVRPRPRCSPKVRLRDSGDEQVATRSPRPASPANVGGSAPSARPSRAVSASPRVISDAWVLSPKPMPVGDADGQRDDVLHRAAELAADHVGVGVGPEVRRVAGRLKRRGGVGVGARDTVAAGCRAAISRARFGPGEHGDPVRPDAGRPREITSLIRLRGAELDALHQATSTARRPAGAAATGQVGPQRLRRDGEHDDRPRRRAPPPGRWSPRIAAGSSIAG